MIKFSLSKGFSTLAIVILVGIVLIGGVGVYMMVGNTDPSASTPSRAGEETALDANSDTVEGELSSTLPDVIGRGQNLECDWRLPVESADNPFNNGKLYTTGNQGRSMITGNLGGGDFEANAIYKNNEVYSWVSVAGNTFGFKFSQDTLESEAADMTPEERAQAEQIREEMIIDCSPWTPDSSMFELPQGVSFN